MVTLATLFASNLSIYRISRLYPGWSRGILYRFRDLLKKVDGLLDRLCREMDHYAPLSYFVDKLSLVLRRWDWIELRRIWSRFVYPARFVPVSTHTN